MDYWKTLDAKSLMEYTESVLLTTAIGVSGNQNIMSIEVPVTFLPAEMY